MDLVYGSFCLKLNIGILGFILLNNTLSSRR